MSDRPNWYHETGPERRAKRHHRFRAMWIWIFVIAVGLVVLSQGGGPFRHGTKCETITRINSVDATQAVQFRCHEDRSWIP